MPETPIREAVYAALLSTLQAAALTIGGRALAVERNRTDSVEPVDCPLLVLLDSDHGAEAGTTLEARYRIRVRLAGYLDGLDQVAVAAAANELHARTIRALFRPGGAAQVTDIVLADGATAIMLAEGGFTTDPATIAESDQPMASCLMELEATVLARWGDPFITTP